jgi:hypothetical protein
MKFCTRKEIPCMIKLAQAMNAPIFMLFMTAGTTQRYKKRKTWNDIF